MKAATIAFSAATALVGIAVVGRTFQAGVGGGLGLVVGGLLVAVGLARLYLTVRD